MDPRVLKVPLTVIGTLAARSCGISIEAPGRRLVGWLVMDQAPYPLGTKVLRTGGTLTLFQGRPGQPGRRDELHLLTIDSEARATFCATLLQSHVSTDRKYLLYPKISFD